MVHIWLIVSGDNMVNQYAGTIGYKVVVES
jgi:hypothetical protein